MSFMFANTTAGNRCCRGPVDWIAFPPFDGAEGRADSASSRAQPFGGCRFKQRHV